MVDQQLDLDVDPLSFARVWQIRFAQSRLARVPCRPGRRSGPPAVAVYCPECAAREFAESA
ncbi:MAG TPA: hypothetical protein VNB91_06225 [Jatrophihabitantaceae bacterium]|nr:hypothetical protein [Jatrophihabitantaceae bacterium]